MTRAQRDLSVNMCIRMSAHIPDVIDHTKPSLVPTGPAVELVPQQDVASRAIAFLLISSEHADGERRGPVSIQRYLKTLLSETFRTPPSDSI